MRELVGSGLIMMLIEGLLLRGRGVRLNASAAVVAGVVHVHDRGAVDDGSIDIDVGYVDVGDVCHRAVICECAAAPHSAAEADAAVTVAIVNAAVEADVGAPVCAAPTVDAARVAAVAPGPENAEMARLYPYTGNTVVACLTVGPVARG